MTDVETVTGTVASTRDWKSGKGSWVNLDNNSNDFFAYKAKVPKVGETGTWKVKEGTGVMADKVELVKRLDDVDLNAVRKESADKDLEIVEKSIESGEKTYFKTQNLINRQSAAKTTSRVVAAMISAGLLKDKLSIANTHLYLADRVYYYITEQEEELLEPPEEP